MSVLTKIALINKANYYYIYKQSR